MLTRTLLVPRLLIDADCCAGSLACHNALAIRTAAFTLRASTSCPSVLACIMVLSTKQKEELSAPTSSLTSIHTTSGHCPLPTAHSRRTLPSAACRPRCSHKSILGYLKSAGLDASYSTLLSELSSTSGSPPSSLTPDDSHLELLEKKWTSIVRLQKRIIELEQANQQLREDIDSAGKGKRIDLSTCLPRAPARSSLAGHRDAVTAVLFHPVYSLLFSASDDATIKVWDSESGRFERSLQGHQDGVMGIALDERGVLLASCSVDLSIKLWDLDSGQYSCIRTLTGHDHTVSSVAFVPGGDQLVSASRDKSIKVWEVATGYCVRTLTGHDQWVRRCIVSPLPVSTTTLMPTYPTASTNATSTTSSPLGSFPSSNSSPPSTAATAAAAAAAAATTTHLLASCSMDQTIRIWNLKTGECISVMNEHTHVVEHIAFTNQLADSNIARLSADDNHNTANGTSATHASTAASTLAASSASSSSSSALSSTANTGGGLHLVSCSRDKSIRLWHIPSATCIRTLIGHDNWVRQVLFTPSGRFMVSCSDDKSIRCWDLQKGAKCVRVLENAHGLFVSCIDWNRSMPLIASGSVDHSIHIWDCR